MYQKILVPLDGSELAECVLPHVEAIAKGCGAINVIFMRVVEPFLRGEYSFTEKELKRFELENREFAKEYLGQLMGRIKSGGMGLQTVAITGKAVESITDYATRNEVDLIVIATHGRSGVSRWAQGSVADRLLRSSCIPVLMVRAPGCVPGIQGQLRKEQRNNLQGEGL